VILCHEGSCTCEVNSFNEVLHNLMLLLMRHQLPAVIAGLIMEPQVSVPMARGTEFLHIPNIAVVR